jgi:hypothetical protein
MKPTEAVLVFTAPTVAVPMVGANGGDIDITPLPPPAAYTIPEEETATLYAMEH